MGRLSVFLRRHLTARQRWLLRELAPIAAGFVLLGGLAASSFTFTWAWEDSAPAPRAATADSAAALRRLRPAPPGSLAVAPPPSPTAEPGLLIPVRGLDPEALTDSFDDPRGAGREHEAIDLLAPRGTPVQAATAGTVARLHTGALGGVSLYQLSRDSSRVFYYAHLDAYAGGLAEGDRVGRGDLLGFVGSTGNAPAGTPHLHFAIWTVEDPENVWDGRPVNPYPLLAE